MRQARILCAIVFLNVVFTGVWPGQVQAQELTEESGSVRARAATLGTQAWLDEIRDRPEAAERSYRELFQLYTEMTGKRN